MKQDSVRLKHILDAMEALEEYASEGHDLFTNDRKTRLAMTHLVQIIGEASRALSDTLKAGAPEIPWKEMGAMRNILVHEYFAADDELIWDVAIKDVPEIRQKIQAIWNNISQ